MTNGREIEGEREREDRTNKSEPNERKNERMLTRNHEQRTCHSFAQISIPNEGQREDDKLFQFEGEALLLRKWRRGAGYVSASAATVAESKALGH